MVNAGDNQRVWLVGGKGRVVGGEVRDTYHIQERGVQREERKQENRVRKKRQKKKLFAFTTTLFVRRAHNPRHLIHTFGMGWNVGGGIGVFRVGWVVGVEVGGKKAERKGVWVERNEEIGGGEGILGKFVTKVIRRMCVRERKRCVLGDTAI